MPVAGIGPEFGINYPSEPTGQGKKTVTVTRIKAGPSSTPMGLPFFAFIPLFFVAIFIMLAFLIITIGFLFPGSVALGFFVNYFIGLIFIMLFIAFAFFFFFKNFSQKLYSATVKFNSSEYSSAKAGGETALKEFLSETFGENIQNEFEQQTGKNLVDEIVRAKTSSPYSIQQQYFQSKPDSLLQPSPFQKTPIAPRWLIIWVVFAIIALGIVVYLFLI